MFDKNVLDHTMFNKNVIEKTIRQKIFDKKKIKLYIKCSAIENAPVLASFLPLNQLFKRIIRD